MDKLTKIILVADTIIHDNINFYSKTLEKPEHNYVNDLVCALKNISKSVEICKSPKILTKTLLNSKVDLVMTIYGGESSRNRMALIPAICESFNTKFMGADVYNRIICQDKHLSKNLAKKFGISTANSILIENEDDIFLINSLVLPLVIKPNFEGSSIGITNKCLVHDYDDGKNIIIEILKEFKQSVLVEEFIKGKEVNITLVGDNKNVNIFEVVEDVMLDNENYFNSNLYTLENKQIEYKKFSHKIITSSISENIKNKIINLYKSLGKIDYIRIDGKLFENEFYLIELTPDPYLADGSSFAKGIMANGYSYNDSIKLLIENCLKYYQVQQSNEIVHKL